MLGLTATTGGYAFPKGGAQRITNAMVTRLEQARRQPAPRGPGHARHRPRPARLRRRAGRRDGDRGAPRAVLADTSVATLLLSLLQKADVSFWLRAFMRRFPQGWGTFKMDWALSAPVPWREEAARHSAVVHAGESVDDLARFTREVRAGKLPDDPYLVIGQHSLIDLDRAPPGPPHAVLLLPRPSPGRRGLAERARTFRRSGRGPHRRRWRPAFARRSWHGRSARRADLEADNANLAGGDLGGGSNAWHRQLLFRPVFPYFRYRMPVAGLYLCSSYAHPGAGVHGMCGYNAALIAAKDLERQS